MFASTVVSVLGLLATANAMPNPDSHVLQSRANPPDIAAITSVPQDSFTSYQTGGLVRHDPSNSTLEKRGCATLPTDFTWGDTDTGGLGILLTNGDTSSYYGFYAYENSCDYVPYKYTWIAPGATTFLSFPAGFAGRITRGIDSLNLDGSPQLLGTWFEFSFDVHNAIWGDVSLIRGCDEGVLMWSTDGSGAWKGFTQDILSDGPTGGYAEKGDGTWVLASTEGPPPNYIAENWEIQQVGVEYVFVDDSHGSPVITSGNGRFGTWWPAGWI